MVLLINTSPTDKMTIALIKRDGRLVLKRILAIHFDHSQKLLATIDFLLKKLRKSIKDIKGVIVVQGPGGFTALRLGILTANTLGFALRIPVVGIKLSEFKGDFPNLISLGLKKLKKAKIDFIVVPYYGKPPNITKPKRQIII